MDAFTLVGDINIEEMRMLYSFELWVMFFVRVLRPGATSDPCRRVVTGLPCLPPLLFPPLPFRSPRP